jgi:hypothetical protein
VLTSPGLREPVALRGGALTAMTDEKKNYRVTDRRHFSPDAESVATDLRSEEADAAAMPSPEPSADIGGPDLPADFIALIITLGTQAGLLLGGAEGTKPDLKGARWLISILEMLQGKTEGRLTPEESEALERLLYELRLAYVARTRTGGA